MTKNNETHETKVVTDYIEVENRHTESMIEEAQRIEGGAPKRVNLKLMPKPIRIFGYFFIAIIIVMVVFALITNFL